MDLDVKMKAVLMGACFLIVSFSPIFEWNVFSEFKHAKYTNILKYIGRGELHVHNAFFDLRGLLSLQDFIFFEKVGDSNQRNTVFS